MNDEEDLEEDLDEEDYEAVMTMEEHYASMGMDHREWDRDYYCLRRASNSSFSRALQKPAVFVKRTTLLEPVRIELLRWKAYLNYAKHMERTIALTTEMKTLPDQECFVPVDEEDLKNSIADAEARGEPFSEEAIHRYSHPRRVHLQEDRSEDEWVRYDDDFWDYQEPAYDKEVAMEVIAAAGCLGEWEQVTLPAREKRAQDSVKLDFGRRWQHETRRGFALQDKCYLLNQLLGASILNADLLPEGPRHVQKLVRVRLNDRLYYFKVGRHYKSADYDLWPIPSDYDEIVVTDTLRPAGTVR